MTEEYWQVILSDQFGVGVDKDNRVVLTLDCGKAPVEAERFRVGIALAPDKGDMIRH
jgi:hypothetical protein